MSDYKATKAYIYQPEPIFKNGVEVERRYGISGPNTEKYFGKRFTKHGAEIELNAFIESELARLETELAKYKKLATGMAEALEYTTCDRRWCQPDRLCHRCAALAEFRDAVKEK